MKYSGFIKTIREKFPNLKLIQRSSQEVAVYSQHRLGIYLCFLVQVNFYSYKHIAIIQNHFNGYEFFKVNSKDFYRVLQTINETFIDAKNKFNIVGS